MIKNSPTSDLPFTMATLTLALFGTLMVFSAGYAYAYSRYDDGAYFMKRQVIWLALGLAVMFLSSHVKPSFYKSITPIIYIITIILLVLVLVVGFVGNGAKRWISIGPLTIQPSEIAKLSVIFILAKYFSDFDTECGERKNKKTVFIFSTLFPILLMLIPIVLVMLQKHLSCIISSFTASSHDSNASNAFSGTHEAPLGTLMTYR